MKRTLTLLQILIPSLFVLGVFSVLVWNEISQQRNQLIADETKRVNNQISILQSIFTTEFNNVAQDLQLLSLQINPESFSTDAETLLPIQQHWLNMIKTHENYQQIRLLDTQGDELIRVERINGSGQVAISKVLQNKQNRDYFQAGLQISEGQILVTEFDLNQEFGKVQIPYQPTVRFIKKHPLGLLIINYSSSKLLQNIDDALSDKIFLMNADGFYLAHSEPKQLWGWLLDQPEANFARLEPELWQELQSSSRIENDQWLLGTILNSIESREILASKMFYAYQLPQLGSTWATLKQNTLFGLLVVSALFFSLIMGWIYFTLIRLQTQSARAKQAKKDADLALNVKTTFLANMSHELRTPLNGIMGFFELLKNESLNKKQMSYATHGFNSSKLLSRILNDILDVSKLEANQLNIIEQPFRLDSLLREVGTLLSSSLKDKSIELWFDVEPNLNTYLVGDDIRIRQILLNLCNNAIKFTEYGYVKLSVKRVKSSADESTLLFAVEDTGIGISPENQKIMFDSFVQVHTTDFSKYGGSGLGLHICQSLLRLMDSQLSVESTLHQGSTFSFSLSLKKAKVPHIAEPDTEHVNNVLLHEMKAIIYSDNTLALSILPKMTSNLGWPTFIAKDKDALITHMASINNNPLVILIARDVEQELLTDDLHELAKYTQPFNQRLVYLLPNASDALHAHFASEQLTIVDGVFVKPLTQSTLY